MMLAAYLINSADKNDEIAPIARRNGFSSIKYNEKDMNDLFTELELPLAYILAEMEYQGVKVDVNRLKQMGEDLMTRLTTMEKKIHNLAGETFNINSPKQLAVVLFENLKLPVIR